MSKKESYYVCNECGYESTKWFMKCPQCNEIGSAVEFTADISNKKKNKGSATKAPGEKPTITYLDENIVQPEKLHLHLKEMNEILNGGLVKGGVYLLSGEPGIGKSTILTQLCKGLEGNIVYASGEESKDQVIARFKRLGITQKNVGLIFETDIDVIIDTLHHLEEKPSFIIIDSIQTMQSDIFDSIPGSVLQVRECARILTDYAKRNNITVVIVGHVNKEGTIAGPKVLEHIVDCVMQFELERSSGLRMLRITKNRFGPTDEIALFEMDQTGLKPIEDVSKYFLEEYSNASGNTLTIIKEGNKLIPIEIQALVSKPIYGTPRRVTSGVPMDRVLMITAVLSKKLKLPLDSKDIFVSTSGGFKSNDSSMDAAIAISIISSLFEQPPAQPTIAIGEIGLDGKIRNVNSIDRRIEFANKLGIEKIVTPNKHSKKFKNILALGDVSEIVKMFGEG